MNWKQNIGPLIDWALSLLGFFPQVAMIDQYGEQLRAFVVVVAEFLEELIMDDTEVKLGAVRLAAFDQLLQQMINADTKLKAEPNQDGLKGVAHWILETYIAGQKAKSAWT
jgi:hypothetical protein